MTNVINLPREATFEDWHTRAVEMLDATEDEVEFCTILGVLLCHAVESCDNQDLALKQAGMTIHMLGSFVATGSSVPPAPKEMIEQILKSEFNGENNEN